MDRSASRKDRSGRRVEWEKRFLRRLGDCGHQHESKGEVLNRAYRSQKSQGRQGQQDSGMI